MPIIKMHSWSVKIDSLLHNHTGRVRFSPLRFALSYFVKRTFTMLWSQWKKIEHWSSKVAVIKNRGKWDYEGRRWWRKNNTFERKIFLIELNLSGSIIWLYLFQQQKLQYCFGKSTFSCWVPITQNTYINVHINRQN